MDETRVAILGAGGRMGGLLIREVIETPGLRLVGALVRPGSPHLGTDAGAAVGLPRLGVALTDRRAESIADAEVVIDFSVPAAAEANARTAVAAGVAMVLGTTGLSAEQNAALRACAGSIPLLVAANTSLGVNLLIGLVRQVAAALDESFDIEIVETHHRHKIDAPSGTALALGRAAAEGRHVDHDARALRGRDGHTGERPTGAIGYASLRGGDVVGDHMVVFAGQGERVEIGHRASSRRIYATGAVRAARWLVGKPPGLYGMRDVLGV